MKYFQKTIIASLIVALVSFAGGLCAHPMAQAARDSSFDMSASQTGNYDMQMSENVPHTISTCVFDCINKTPQATVTKKTTVDNTLSSPLAIFQIEPLPPLFIPDTFGAAGMHPPSPDILSSVFKRE